MEYRNWSEYPDYSFYEDGAVISYKRKIPITLVGTKDKYGYQIYLLVNKDNIRKYIKIHRIIAYLYCNPTNNWVELCVNHIDGNKLNNHFTNLEWCTVARNNQHAIATKLNVGPIGEKARSAKLTQQDVIEILKLLKSSKYTQIDIAKKYNVGNKCISKIHTEKIWKHISRSIINENN